MRRSRHSRSLHARRCLFWRPVAECRWPTPLCIQCCVSIQEEKCRQVSWTHDSARPAGRLGYSVNARIYELKGKKQGADRIPKRLPAREPDALWTSPPCSRTRMQLADNPVFVTRRAPHAFARSLFRRRYLELIDDMILSRDLCRLCFDGFLFLFVTDRPLQRDHSAARDDLHIVSIR
jgi:hypothetical protein